MARPADDTRREALTRLSFRNYTVDPATAALSRDGARIPMQAQPARLLVLLAAHAGQIVGREEIRQWLWPDTTVEYDQSINYCIRQLRIALGHDADLIETVPRQGYRFVGTVMPAALAVPPHRRAAIARTMLASAAVLLTVFALGFGTGIIAREGEFGQFVYVHLVHPDRCPYMRFLIPAHRNS